MKKTYQCIVMALAALFISACSSNETNEPSLSAIGRSNVILEAELNDREEAILSTTTDQAFVFDFEVGDTYKQVSVWVEKYQSGELVDEEASYLTSNIDKDGSIIFTVSKAPESQQSIFSTSITSDNSTSSVQRLENIFEENREGMAALWGSAVPEKTPIKEGMVLASISYSDNSGMESLSSDFYQDVSGNLDEITEYDVVYLFRATFEE